MSLVFTTRDDDIIVVPDNARSLAGFRAWVYSDQFPERGRISFFGDEVLVDMSPERILTHNQVRVAVDFALVSILKHDDLGCYYADGARLTNRAARISTEPDGMFASWASFESKRLRLATPKNNAKLGIELIGTPDLVVEVTSDSSVRKDKVLLLEGYHRAEIPEYWLIDVRRDEIQFQIFHWRKQHYVTAKSEDGLLQSKVLPYVFSLVGGKNRVGHHHYTMNYRRLER